MLKNVSPELIENVKDLKIALNELTVHDLSVYSMIELYYKVAHKLNEVIKELSRFEGVLSDEVIKQNEKLIYLLGEGLENEVIKNIDRLIEDNFFEEVINEKIFTDLNNKIDNVSLQLEQNIYEINNKVNKDDLARISSGTPIIVENNSDMIDITRNYVNINDGYIYVYNGSIFEKTNIQYLEKGISDKSINIQKLGITELVEDNNVLFNLESGKFYTGTYGDKIEIINNASNNILLIEVEPSTTYRASKTVSCFYLKDDYTIIGNIGSSNTTFTTPNDCYKLAMNITNDDLNNWRFYRQLIKKDYINISDIENKISKVFDVDNSNLLNVVTDLKLKSPGLDNTKKYYIGYIGKTETQSFIQIRNEDDTTLCTRFGSVLNGVETFTSSIYEKNIELSGTIDWDKVKKGQTNFTINQTLLKNSVLINTRVATSKWCNKEVLIIGDSISDDSYGGYKKWQYYWQKRVNSKMDVNAFHATGFVADSTTSDKSKSLYNRLKTLNTSIDYKLIVLFMGTNDFGHNVPIGSVNEIDYTTFIPTVDYCLKYIRKTWLNAKVVVLLPLQRMNVGVNLENKYLLDYNNELKRIAQKYSIPTLDLYNKGNFYPYLQEFSNKWTFYAPNGQGGHAYDGLHPNEEFGRDYLGITIEQFLENI